MADIVRWVRTQDVSEAEQAIQATSVSEAIDGMTALGRWDHRTRANAFTAAQTLLTAYADPAVAEASARCDVDLGILARGRNTIYVCAPADDQERLQPLFEVILRFVVRGVTQLYLEGKAPLNPPVRLVLDEAAYIASIRDLDRLASTAVGMGMQMVTIWQDFAQLVAAYGERATTVINNHRAKVFLGGGISDPGTLDYVSRLAGEEEVSQVSATRRAGGRSQHDPFDHPPEPRPLGTCADTARRPCHPPLWRPPADPSASSALESGLPHPSLSAPPAPGPAHVTDEERPEDLLTRRAAANELARARFLEFVSRGGAHLPSNAAITQPVAAAPAESDGIRPRVPWDRLTAEQLRQEWDRLIAWVGWAIRAYSISDWPPCWAEHEGLVAHIDGQRRWHQAVYAGDVDGAKATAWHESFERLSVLRNHSLCRAPAEKSAWRAQDSVEAGARVRDVHHAARAAEVGVSHGAEPGAEPSDSHCSVASLD